MCVFNTDLLVALPVMSNFLYLWYIQVYPTTIRAMGLGMCSGMARIGALVTPFVAQVSQAFFWQWYWQTASVVIIIQSSSPSPIITVM